MTSSVTTRASQVPTFGSEQLRQVINQIGEGAEVRELTDSRPHEEVDLVRRSRVGALRIPHELGGGGASFRQLFATVIDLAEADSNVAHLLRNHFLFVEQQLRNPATDIRDKWLGLVLDGDLFSSAAGELTPATVGSADWYNFRTTAVVDGDGYRITGEKFYTTGALYADWITVLATGPDGLVSATIPTRREGVIIVDDWDGIGQRSTASGTVRLENVRVEPGEVFSTFEIVDGAIPPSYANTLAQLWLQAVIAGELRNVVTDAVTLLHTRSRSFSHAPTETLTDDPLLQQTVGQLSATAYAAESLVLNAADTFDVAWESAQTTGYPSQEAVTETQLRSAQAKIHIDQIATQAASTLFDVGSASSTQRSKNLDRHWRNIRTLASHNPTPYKALGVGAYLVNGTAFNGNGYF